MPHVCLIHPHVLLFVERWVRHITPLRYLLVHTGIDQPSCSVWKVDWGAPSKWHEGKPSAWMCKQSAEIVEVWVVASSFCPDRKPLLTQPVLSHPFAVGSAHFTFLTQKLWATVASQPPCLLWNHFYSLFTVYLMVVMPWTFPPPTVAFVLYFIMVSTTVTHQGLRAHIVPVEDPRFVPRTWTHIRQLKTARNSSSKDSDALWSLREPGIHYYTHKLT